jgi:hypothetical protein
MRKFAASSTSSMLWRVECSKSIATRSRRWQQRLLELETIDADQINDIMEGKPPRPPKQPQAPSPSKPDHNTPDAAPSATAPA